ncbi:MAG TPA: OmpA family protein [Burkholderiales bacterium]|nr:OmpA family protein [Burkholderiales bacterium]
MKPMTKFVLAACAAMALNSAAALAQTSGDDGYLVNNGQNVTKSGFGLCWHTAEWKPGSPDDCSPAPKPVAAAPAPAPAPAPVAAVSPPPAPVVAQAPPPARPLQQKISFSADALFDFDKAVLKPKGKEMLDGLVQQISGADYGTLTATGHTDRFGTDKYNQRLSERRAGAVKAYLVSRDIPASRIEAFGKGETQPVTKPGECKGAKTAKVVACLQPDRRVDVEMSGSKTVAASR